MAQRRKKRKPMPESQKLSRRIQGWERTGQPEKAAEGRLVLERVLVREQEQRDANEKRRERYYAKQAEQKALLEQAQGAGAEEGEADGGGPLSAGATGEGGDAGAGTGQPPDEEGRTDVLLPDLGGMGEAVGGLGGQVGGGRTGQAGPPMEARGVDAPRSAALGTEGGDRMAVEAQEAAAVVERDQEIEALRAQLAAAQDQLVTQASSSVALASMSGRVPKGLRKLNVIGRPRDTGNFRAVTVVMPACQVPTATKEGTEYTTGPCQQAVRSIRSAWWKTCTHGPTFDEFGKEIPPRLRPYYEGGLSETRTPVVGEGGEVTGWNTKTFYKTNLRITYRALAPVAAGGYSLKIAVVDQGGKDVTEFGVHPFCNYYNCYSQEVSWYSLMHGWFCSPGHAKMIKAREDGMILPLAGFDSAWAGSPSTRKRREVLAGINVGEGVAV